MDNKLITKVITLVFMLVATVVACTDTTTTPKELSNLSSRFLYVTCIHNLDCDDDDSGTMDVCHQMTEKSGTGLCAHFYVPRSGTSLSSP
jgi:hypothetical protein